MTPSTFCISSSREGPCRARLHLPLVADGAFRPSSGARCGPVRHPNPAHAPRRYAAAAGTGSNSSTSSSNGHGSSSVGEAAASGSGSGSAATTSAATSGDVPAAASAAVAASVAAAAAAPTPPVRTTATQLLRRVLSLLRAHLPAMLLLYALKDAAAFLLHRVTQRLTNHAAEVLLGYPTSTVGNPWWLYLDPAFIRAHPGYELLVGFFFLACLPLNIALNSAAFTAAALVCTPPEVRQAAMAAGPAAGGSLPSSQPPYGTSARSGGGGSQQGVGGALYLPANDPATAALADLGIHSLPVASQGHAAAAGGPTSSLDDVSTVAAIAAAAALSPPPPPVVAAPKGAGSAGPGQAAATTAGAAGAAPSGGPIDALRAAASSVAVVLPEMVAALRRVWWTDLQVNARVLPLQGLCLLVLPALWALPRLLRIQVALPAAVLERRTGMDALDRSSSLMASSLAAYGMPFAALLAAGRLLEYVQGVALVLIPPRWWRDAVEVPLIIAGAFLLIKAAVHRLQDLLPLAAYLELTQLGAVLDDADTKLKAKQEEQQQQHVDVAGAGEARPGAAVPVAVSGTAASAGP